MKTMKTMKAMKPATTTRSVVVSCFVLMFAGTQGACRLTYCCFFSVIDNSVDSNVLLLDVEVASFTSLNSTNFFLMSASQFSAFFSSPTSHPSDDLTDLV